MDDNVIQLQTLINSSVPTNSADSNNDDSASEEETGVDISDQYVDKIVKSVEMNSILQQQAGKSATFKDIVRAVPNKLTVKRKIRGKLLRTRSSFKSRYSLRDNNQNCCSEYFKYVASILLTKIKSVIYDLSTTFELWYGSLKTIEGRFGSAIGTYFKFYRLLFLINVILFIMSLMFIIIPQLTLRDKSEISESRHRNTTNLHWRNSNTSFKLQDLITGRGYFTDSILFHGFFQNRTVYLGPISYSLPKAYLYSIGFSYIITLLILCIYMTNSYQRYFVQTKGGTRPAFCQKVFCGWDFSIATDEAAMQNREVFSREIKELLEEQRYQVTATISLLDSLKTYTSRTVLNIIYVAIVYGIGILELHLLEDNTGWYVDLGKNKNKMQDYLTLHIPPIHDAKDSVGSLMFALYVTSILWIMMKLFLWFTSYEKYTDPRKPLYITIVRMFIIEIVIVSVFMKFWITTSNQRSKCWETYLSQEIYQMLVIDFLASTFGTMFYKGTLFTRTWWLNVRGNNRAYCNCKPAEFDIADHTFSLIHGQMLFWIGFYFSPSLSIVMLILMFITFYVKKYSLIYVYSPLSKSWRAAQTQTVFLALAFFSLLLVMSMCGYIIVDIRPSQNCGPFRDVQHAYNVIVNDTAVNDTDDHFELWNLVAWIKKPGVVFGLLLVLCGNAYFTRARSQTEVKLAETLRNVLALQAKDKRFLTEMLSQSVTNTSPNSGSLGSAYNHGYYEDIRKQLDMKRKVSISSANSNTSSHALASSRSNHLTVPTSVVVEGLRGIPGSPRTQRFTQEKRTKSRDFNKLLKPIISQHKSGLFT